MRKIRLARLVLPALALGLATTACANSGGGGGSGSGPVRGLQVIVPNSPGSGYDTTARAAVKAMEDAELARSVEVSNVAGAGGTVGLQRVVNEKGNGDLLLQMGLGLVGATYTNKSKATLKETTPIASLIQAQKAGVAPKDVNYVSYDGGGELMTALLGSKVAFGATGTGEVVEQAKSGKVRVLAVTSAQRVPDVEAPTLKEAGVDLEFTNWRGLVAPPGISDDDKAKLIGLVEKMRNSQQWKDALAKHGWTDAYLSGDAFAAFLESEQQRVQQVLGELGLA